MGARKAPNVHQRGGGDRVSRLHPIVTPALEADGFPMLGATADAPDARPRSLVVRNDVPVRPVGRDIALHAIVVAELHERLARLLVGFRIRHRERRSPLVEYLDDVASLDLKGL